jgi:probable rRNA maturation factor
MSKTNSPIQFHLLTPASLAARRILKDFIVTLFRKEKKPMKEVHIIFCTDNYLLALNRQFLKHDFYTDILSFPLSLPGEPLVAEIYISIDRVRENAKSLGSSFSEELHRVIFHGILHFCGYKDKTLGETRKMRAMEDKCLKAYFKPKTRRPKPKTSLDQSLLPN